MESGMFKECLINGSLEGLASIPNGGNVAYIEKTTNVKVEPPSPGFPSLTEMCVLHIRAFVAQTYNRPERFTWRYRLINAEERSSVLHSIVRRPECSHAA